RNKWNTASVFFSLYLRSQVRIALCSLLRVPCPLCRVRGRGVLPVVEGGSTYSGALGLGKKSHYGPPLSALIAVCVLAGCADIGKIGTVDPRFGVSSGARLYAPGEPIPKGGGTYRVGSPYSIGGRTYVPAEDPQYRAEGLASWYGEDFHGRQT